MNAIINYCEAENIPAELSLIYLRNLTEYGKEVADFYTYEVEGDLGDP